MMFSTDDGAGPTEHPGGQSAPPKTINNRRPYLSPERRPTPRSVHIISMQDSNVPLPPRSILPVVVVVVVVVVESRGRLDDDDTSKQ